MRHTAIAVLLTAGLAISACTSHPTPNGKAAGEPTAVATEQSPPATTQEPSPTASATPVLTVGQTGTYSSVDVVTEKPTTFKVTVNDVKYVGISDEDATTSAAEGQYVRLVLTLENVGKHPGKFAAYGCISWEDADTPAQDVTTLNLPPGPDLDTTYKPGQKLTGRIILDVPERGGIATYNGDGSFSVKLPA